MKPWGLVWLLCFGAGAARAVSPEQIAVAWRSDVPAYAECLEGIRQGLGTTFQSVDLARAGRPALSAAARGKVVLAVGADAMHAGRELGAGAPMVVTMVLSEEAAAARNGGPVFSVVLDVPFPAVLDRLRRSFPDRTRLGIIYNPRRRGEERAILAAQARAAGFTPALADASGPAELLKAFRSLIGSADMVLCFPDSSLYNSATIKPFILASLENRLPIVGFSANFVRAGAAFGVYPDFRAVGRQAAEAALRWAPAVDRAPEENPRELVAAVNQRVLHLLGIQLRAGSGLAVFR